MDYLNSDQRENKIADNSNVVGVGRSGGGRMPELKIPTMQDFRGNLPNVSLPNFELPKIPQNPWKGINGGRNVIDVDVDESEEVMQPRQTGNSDYLNSLAVDTSEPIDRSVVDRSGAMMFNISLPNMTMPDFKGSLPNFTLPQVSLPEFSLPDVEIPKMPTPSWSKKVPNAQVIIDLDVRPKQTGNYLDSLGPVTYAENQPMNYFGALPELDIPWRGTRKMKKSDDSWTMPSNYDILDALKASTNKVTGKNTYEFGDLTRYAISQANAVHGGLKGDAKDLSQQVNRGIKDRIDAASLNAADVSRTIIKKISTGDFDLADVTFSLRVLMVLGADFSPIASLLPISMLMEVFGFALVSGFGERFFTAIAKEIDTRMLMNEKETLPESKGESSKGYVAGDLTKQAIQAYTGKDTYNAGDIASGMNLLSDSSGDDNDTIDVLKELEECLQMERELVEKLNRVSGSRPI